MTTFFLNSAVDSTGRLRSFSTDSAKASPLSLISNLNWRSEPLSIGDLKKEDPHLPSLAQSLNSHSEVTDSVLRLDHPKNSDFLFKLRQKLADYSASKQTSPSEKESEGHRETIRDHQAFKKCLQAEDRSHTSKKRISNEFSNKFKKHILDSKNQYFSVQKMDEDLTYLSLESLTEFEQVRSLNCFLDNRAFCARRFSKSYFKHVVIETSEREEMSELSLASNREIYEYIHQSSIDSRQISKTSKNAISPPKFMVTIANSQANKGLLDSCQESLSTKSHSKDLANECHLGRKCRDTISEFEFESVRKEIDFDEGFNLSPEEILSTNDTTPSKQFQSFNPHNQSSTEKTELNSSNKPLSDKLITSFPHSTELNLQVLPDSTEFTNLLKHDLLTNDSNKKRSSQRLKVSRELVLQPVDQNHHSNKQPFRDNRFIPNFN